MSDTPEGIPLDAPIIDGRVKRWWADKEHPALLAEVEDVTGDTFMARLVGPLVSMMGQPIWALLKKGEESFRVPFNTPDEAKVFAAVRVIAILYYQKKGQV